MKYGVMVNMPDDPAQIVRFWHAVEMFSPQQLPRTDARNHVADLRPWDPMPWEPDGRLPQAKPGKVWRHEVFGGVYDLSKIRDVLVKEYGQDDPEAPARGQSALFACTVDADGYLVEESALLSSCAWAIGQILHGKPILTGFREDALNYAEGLQKLTGVTKILADSVRNAVPDAVSGGVTVAVTAALGPVGGPLAAAGGAMAGSLAGKLAKSAVGTKGGEQTKTEAGGESRSRARLDQAPLTGSDLYRFTAELAGRLGVTKDLHPQNIRVSSYEISASRAGEPPASSALAAHQPGRPGLFALLSGRGRTTRRIWETEHAELNSRFVAADRERDSVSRTARDVTNRLAAACRDEGNARSKRDRLTHELEELRCQVRAADLRWGDHVPDGPECAETVEQEQIQRREKSAPWADAEFTAARTELFLAALALHRALILAEAPTFRRNLSALIDIFGGKGRPSNAATLAAWQTFFLVVPVVSTTFASFDKLFGGLGCEALGWLFVDEAGQAPPQYAVGALWRARRAVIVGDPLQLKPVVTLPWGGQRALLREFGVGKQWAPSRTSVQQVADRLAEHGTALPGPASDEPVWVGAPLRVHRRCDRPMFGISNQIAYDGLMVFGTPDRPAFHGQDEWRHIRSATSNGHWIPAEGEELRSVLSELRDAGIIAAQIRVISPFRMVAGQAMEVHESVFPEVSARDREKWVGTVHTMQGKEAEVVILVLGGDPDRPGARGFATREPNLLNVAVTRAKRRLYVIGNRDNLGQRAVLQCPGCPHPRRVTSTRYRYYTSIALTPGRSPKRALASRLRIIRPVSAA
jgi:AAA domain